MANSVPAAKRLRASISPSRSDALHVMSALTIAFALFSPVAAQAQTTGGTGPGDPATQPCTQKSTTDSFGNVSVALACGQGSSAPSNDATATAIGSKSTANGGNTTAIGDHSLAMNSEATAISDFSQATQAGATAIGGESIASGVNSVAVGEQSSATDFGAVAVGNYATATNSSVAIGQDARATGIASVALGSGASAAQTFSSAIGRGAVTTRDNELALGGAGSSVVIGDIVASTGAQVGPTSIVTVDASGTLGQDTTIRPAISALQVTDSQQNLRITALEAAQSSIGGRVETVNRNGNGGIAAAMAMGGTVMPADAKMAVSFNLATYRGEQGFSASGVARATKHIYFQGGFAGSTVKGSTGARVGATFAW